MVARYCWHLLQQLPFTYNKSGSALKIFLVVDNFLAMDTLIGLRLCRYSTVTCSKTSTSNMFTFSLGFMWSLTNAKANWSLGLKASNSLNIRQENRLLLSPCSLRISALSGTSANYIWFLNTNLDEGSKHNCKSGKKINHIIWYNKIKIKKP